ncbi:MAG TPA: hypothetical protein VGB50_11180 [Flavobacterium sp.]|jgi:hypothetical protein
MKKITLFAVLLLIANTAGATEAVQTNRPATFSFEEPIMFTERGIDFFIFPNGEFDFNTETSTGSGQYFRRGGANVNITYGAPGNLSSGVLIEHDALGRVRRIGNVFVNYDHANRIKRIGTVYMTYSRSGLTQIGGLRIIYDRRGRIIDINGSVKGYQPYAYNSYNNSYYGPANGSHTQNDYYYYKTDGTKTKVEEKEKK